MREKCAAAPLRCLHALCSCAVLRGGMQVSLHIRVARSRLRTAAPAGRPAGRVFARSQRPAVRARTASGDGRAREVGGRRLLPSCQGGTGGCWHTAERLSPTLCSIDCQGQSMNPRPPHPPPTSPRPQPPPPSRSHCPPASHPRLPAEPPASAPARRIPFKVARSAPRPFGKCRSFSLTVIDFSGFQIAWSFSGRHRCR